MTRGEMTNALYIPPNRKDHVVKICAACKKPLGQHFQVTRYSATSEDKGSVVVCSLLCLLNWTYQKILVDGTMLAVGAKNAVQQIIDSLRGSGGTPR